ncbi:restriction endonuclease [Sporolactobacillus laevolacticus]|uniref:restriction endonuclease n=1 Tax=Sporolactobacillus laevolacticus TaxID=33018 RepID=UPI0025B32C47|nr:restriction endonuclease [Sporolactobacillus laevolacticus]MDN3956213.1 restriction endonuclease [Sporolactobacillus laevolacticus]
MSLLNRWFKNKNGDSSEEENSPIINLDEKNDEEEDNLKVENNNTIINAEELELDSESEEYEDPDYMWECSPDFEVKHFYFDKENKNNSRYISGILKIEDDIHNHKVIFNGQCLTKNEKNCKVYINIQRKIGDDYFIKFDGLQNCHFFLSCNFIMNEDTLTKLIYVYDNINLNIKHRIDKFDKEYLKYVYDLKGNADINLMCLNFLKNRKDNFLFDKAYTISLERRILYLGQIGINTLILPTDCYSQFEIIDEIENASYMFYNDLLRFYQIIYPLGEFFPIEYDTSQINISKAIFILWKLIREVSVDYFSNAYLEENNLSIDDFPINNVTVCLAYHLDHCFDAQSKVSLASFTYLMMKIELLESTDFYKNYDYIVREVAYITEQIKLQRMKQELLNSSSLDKMVLIEEVDLMSGIEFENLIGKILKKLGYSVEVTKTSGDQGIDVIAEKNGRKIGIQSKCYSNTVGNKAIQEVVAGLNYYQLDKGLVVTNNYFTDSAKELANANNIILWDRTMLEEKLNELHIEQ